MNKIEIHPLPITDVFVRQKRLIQERGELALIEDGLEIRHLGYFSLRALPGAYRGGHHHIHKIERSYLISGVVRIDYVDIDTSDRGSVEAIAGSRIIIHPRLAHRFAAISDAQVIEYYDRIFDPDDEVPFGQF